MRLADELGERLERRAADGLLRTLAPPSGVDLVSNDYLGFSRFREDLGETNSLPAARLLGGDSAAHQALEARVARWKGHDAALLFPSGYQANVSAITALIGRGDRVLSDVANHASLIDGVRLARPAEVVIFEHLDRAAVRAALARPHHGRTFVVTESLFGMDGDRAPLDDYLELCRAHDAELIVDDAHATGVYGLRGEGLAPQGATAVITTFGKSLAAAGAAVSGPAAVIAWLAQTARGFVYSTALSPLLVALVSARLDRLGREPRVGERPRALATELRARLRAHGHRALGEDAPIVPVMSGDVDRALALAAHLSARGFDVRAVRPPTVPRGTARIRLSVHADHTPEMLTALSEAMR